MNQRKSLLSRFAVLCAVALLTLLLAACTRDRPAPATPDSATTEPAGAVAETPDAGLGAGEASATSPAESGGEPVVTAAADSGAQDGTATPEAEATTGEHEVQSGDTLMSIALEYDTDVETLRRLNFLPDDVIQVGQMLLVPITPPTPTPTPAPFIHVVAAGDTLFSLVRLYGVSAEDIVTANNITDPNTLVPGTELLIPGYSAQGEAAAPAAETVDGTPVPAPGGDELVEHIVGPGETLSEIAQRYGVDEGAIASANGITNRNQLRTGQALTIPGLTRAQLREAQTITHTVLAGETLSEIAQRYGVESSAIIAENGLANPNDIRVGQELRIPPP